MKRFLINIAAFCFLVAVTLASFYWLYIHFTLPREKNTVYVWGDSQMYQDLDLQYLNKNSPHQFRSAALSGAGIYDFVVFSRLVPENSNVVIQISHTVVLRRKTVDRNYSAVNFDALAQLKKNNYSITELVEVMKNNVVPHKIFDSKNNLFPVADTICLAQPLSLFQTVYAERPSYFSDKENLYLEGINMLLKKKCKIIALTFPKYPLLNEIEQKSPFYNDLLAFDAHIGGLFKNKDSIIIKAQGNIFYDLTHFNARGAQQLTTEIVTHLKFDNSPTIINVKPASENTPTN